MKNKIVKLVLAIWIILWISGHVRELFVKNNIRDYKILMNKSLEGKKAYVVGERFYEFLTFCNKELPEGAKYAWVKMDKEDHARRISTYYLYPHLEEEGTPFLLVYDDPNVLGNGYEIFAKLDNSRYILKKKGN